MTVQSAVSRVDYVGNGSQTIFPYPFRIFDDGDLRVLVSDVLQTIATHYTVSGVEEDGGGNVTFLAAPLNAAAVSIRRVLALTQDVDYQELTKFPAEVNEQALDRGVMISQQLAEVDSRSLKFEESSTALDKSVPDPESGRALRWKADLSGLENFDVGTGSIATPVSVANGGTGASTPLGARQNLFLDGQVRKSFVNRTGVSLVAGDVVTWSASNDDSVVLGDTVASKATLVVAAESMANLATGEFILEGVTLVNVTGSVTRGRYVRKSNTTKVGEDSTVAMSAANDPPQGAFAVALRANAGGQVMAYCFGFTTAVGTPIVTGMYGVRGLSGSNNSGAPTTQFDLDADQVQLFKPSDGSIVVRQNPGSLTNDLGTATPGPVASGRDQAGAFAANSWVHLYYIWNGTTLSTISSLAAPTGAAGPTMPSGFTHWAYAGAVRWNNSSNIVATIMRASWAYYNGQVAVLAGANATTETAIATGAFIPPNALTILLSADGAISLASSVTHLDATLTFYAGAGAPFRTARLGATGTSDSNTKIAGLQLELLLPNSGYVAYKWTESFGGSSKSLNLWANGYQMPNGGE